MVELQVPTFIPMTSAPFLGQLSTKDGLIDLARARSASDQHHLLLGLANLYKATAHPPQDLADIFIALTRTAERHIRQALADLLASADWAPGELVRMLAADEIEIATPVIAHSPLLQDEDLLKLLASHSIEHQIQIALRPDLGSEPARAIVDSGNPSVMMALANNPSARLDASALTGLVEHSRQIAALRAPLSRHPQLTETLALRLCEWVGEALRHAISTRFELSPERLAFAMKAASLQASSMLGPQFSDESAAQLVGKLHSADQLRPAYLIRALREEKLGVFVHGLATLGGFQVDHICRALQASTARPLFLACIAVGLDRAAFPALLAAIRALNHGFPHDPDEECWRLAERSATQAAYEFRLLMEEQ